MTMTSITVISCPLGLKIWRGMCLRASCICHLWWQSKFCHKKPSRKAMEDHCGRI